MATGTRVTVGISTTGKSAALVEALVSWALQVLFPGDQPYCAGTDLFWSPHQITTRLGRYRTWATAIIAGAYDRQLHPPTGTVRSDHGCCWRLGCVRYFRSRRTAVSSSRYHATGHSRCWRSHGMAAPVAARSGQYHTLMPGLLPDHSLNTRMPKPVPRSGHSHVAAHLGRYGVQRPGHCRSSPGRPCA